MIVSCPACQTRYQVPAASLAAGPREVHCARCDHTWRADAPQEPAEIRSAKQAGLSPPPFAGPFPLSPSSAPASPWRRMALIGFLLVAAALFGWLVLDRDSIARGHPWMEGVYGRLGLHIYHAGEGLVLTDVHSEMQFNGGLLQLEVAGKISNATAKMQAIPDLLAVAMGSDGKPMESWKIAAPAAKVAPGATLPFQSDIRAPKGTVVAINLSFVEPDHAP